MTPSRCLIGLMLMLLLPGACGGRDAWLHEPLPDRGAVVPPAPTPAVGPRVRFTTSVGDFVVVLYEGHAPVTTANFLRYVDDGFYDGTIFHRVESEGSGLAVIQGGGRTPDLTEKPTREPIVNEASNGLSNVRGTIAMARLTDSDTATAQFFINYADNLVLDYGGQQNSGYAVFGVVVEGIEVIDRISLVPTQHVAGTNHNSVPMVEVLIERARRD